ncbi:MAG: hypothetical protein KKE23_00595 [Nanoarchaeota archaeon]|nr:hypothetical protein [Nanoarchaeota archaeon]
MVFENISSMAPEQLADFLGFLENGIKAIGGILVIYILILLWKLWMTRKNRKLMLSMQKDISKIKKKLKMR